MELFPCKLVKSVSSSVSSARVWIALQIWHNKPHIINRHLAGALRLMSSKLDKSASVDKLCKIITDTQISSLMPDYEVIDTFNQMKIFADENKIGCHLVIQKLLAKNTDLHSSLLQIAVLDELSCKITFFVLKATNNQPRLVLMVPYTFQFLEGEIQLISHDIQVPGGDNNIGWIMNHVFPKILKWAENDQEEALPSLSLIPFERYILLYQELKKKYGQQFVKIWPENTDPLKFVYEDVAIASYLLVLWEEQRKARDEAGLKQSFVDLGCGNGLLVHILSSEGHHGFGLDVRKRGIWDLYPSTTVLKVQTITPSDSFLFPETDWIIGNHSDELTPWIPVIAARSSYSCSFFVLPCCSYDFNGCKYLRQLTNQSTYSEYLDFVQNLGEVCGFETQRDKLRIPSTKRICLIGSKRTYSVAEEEGVQKRIKEFINGRCVQKKTGSPLAKCVEENWVEGFKPRESKEIVRNCTKIDKGVINKIVDIVASLILRDHRKPDQEVVGWDPGNPIPIAEIAAEIPKELMKELKQECGGLQTLLRNNNRIFSVVDGKVRFTTPVHKDVKLKTLQKSNRQIKLKVSPCWFHNNHPNGCPLTDEDCSFKH